MLARFFILTLLFFYTILIKSASGQSIKLSNQIEVLSKKYDSKVVTWRRHFHQYPELSNREFKTAKKIAEILRSFDLEVQTGIAKTGVVAILDTKKEGPVIGLRADIDALPVKEKLPLSFASKEKGQYRGETVPVMHACGHDTHIAILLGAAKVLSEMKDKLTGKIKFIFQPAEEGPPKGEEGGAKLMVKEGVLKNPNVEVMFGLHINSKTDIGKIGYGEGGVMASSNSFKISIQGKQTHGGYPWGGKDPIVIASQIIMGLQTVVSRQTELTKAAAVVSVGIIKAGVRSNIIPDKATLIGTIRCLDPEYKPKMFKNIKTLVKGIAQANGASATIEINDGYPVTYNHIKLTQMMIPSLVKAAGKTKVFKRNPVTGAEDFSFYANEVPSLFFFLGGKPLGKTTYESPAHHTPKFYIDDSKLDVGVKAFCFLVTDYMEFFKKGVIKI